MPRPCTVCTHPQRPAIDKALVTGGNHRETAALYRVSPDAITRHNAAHLPKMLVQSQEVKAEARALDVVAQLKAVNAAALGVLRDAREAGDGELILKAVDRVVRQIEFQARLLGELDERPVVNILVAPEWLDLRGRILAALTAYPQARTALAEALDAS